jgi:3-hydroxyacyl-CoA dehydrogenase/enoyl-CoA hydratase/3-hydroxybutyryl-CoA epimerase
MIEITKEICPTGAWRLEDAGDGCAFLVFDVPGEKVNILSEAVLRDLDRVLDLIAKDASCRALIVVSGKGDTGTYIAGADIHEIRAVRTASEAAAKAASGQRVLGRFGSIPQVTVAAVHGACLGGGTELILACDLRVASHHPKTRIGLPEVQLGILPGFGGSQRLPRLVGIARALPIILSGKPQSVESAAKIGLVDRVVYPGRLREEAKTLATAALANEGKEYRPHRPKRPFLLRMLEAIPAGRRFIGQRALREAERKAGPHYPAPAKAIDAVIQGFGQPIDRGLELEARLVGELAASSVAKNLIDLFLSSELARRGDSKRESGPSCSVEGDVVGVLGAGIMGGGIAELLVRKGFRVRLKDIALPAIQSAFARVDELLSKRVERRSSTPSEKDNALSAITATLDTSGFRRTRLVIEAVVENLEVKRAALREIEAAVAPDAILASNTSSLSITEIARGLARPESFVGLHFFNPVDRMMLVEVIRGESSSESALERVEDLARRLGKIPVRVRDGAGFLVNRLLGPYLNEAVRLFSEGYSIVEIDAWARGFGMPVGPFELLDEVGLDVAAKVSHVLHAAFGERARPPELLDKILADPTTRGRKTGRGFYRHGGRKPTPNREILALGGTGGKDFKAADPDLWLRRLIYPLVNEAARALEEGVVDGPSTLDLAMVMGTGFAPFRGGPLRYADSVGLNRIATAMRELGEPRLAPAPYLEQIAASSETFYARGQESGVVESRGEELEKAQV